MLDVRLYTARESSSYGFETIIVKLDDIELKLEKKEKGFVICNKSIKYVGISFSLGFYYSENALIRQMNVFEKQEKIFWMHLPKRQKRF